MLHTSDYKSATVFAGKRVLVIGAGNSGCDIAVDAVHHAKSVDLSVRRGYHFVPKYLFGKPADTLNQGKPLPPRIKQAIDSRVLRMFTGDPTRFGFPKPDHKIYESHPIVNTLVLHHLGHGDIHVRKDVERFDGSGVRFVDGSRTDYDLIVLATGYQLHYPFVDPAPARLDRDGAGPLPQRVQPARPEPVRARHDRGLRHRLAGPLRAGRAGRSVLKAREVAPDRARGLRGAGARSAAGPVGRLPLPRARADGLLRQQGRLPGRRTPEIERLEVQP